MASVNTKKNLVTEVNHLYNTPIDALEAAYQEGIFDRFHSYYDPCNGLGKISNFLKSKGKVCATSDLIDYGWASKKQGRVVDFFEVTEETLPRGTECLVFNPPFKLTEEFIDHALSLCNYLIMFNRSTTLETASRSKKHKDGSWRLKEIYSHANRVSCSEGVDEKATANSVWYIWTVYDQTYQGKPTFDWIFTK